ncbi:MAG: hypothetical protein U0Z17_05280 [Bacteroidales bacterium]
MILIADGGSTKTDWRLLKDGREYKQVQTQGFNPYLVGSDAIEDILWKELQPYIDNEAVSHVYYYGAGCSTPVKNMIVETAFEKVFVNARINISHDLLGAAHALCADSEGIVAILGTGSNSCYYDGREIKDGIFRWDISLATKAVHTWVNSCSRLTCTRNFQPTSKNGLKRNILRASKVFSMPFIQNRLQVVSWHHSAALSTLTANTHISITCSLKLLRHFTSTRSVAIRNTKRFLYILWVPWHIITRIF